MKKIIALILVLLVVACSKKTEETEKVLYLFNWSDYMPQEILDEFYEETGIKVIMDSYASNEEMYTKIAAGSSSYDIIFPSADYQEIMIKQDMLEKIDKTKIPNIAQLNKEIISKIDKDTTSEIQKEYNNNDNLVKIILDNQTSVNFTYDNFNNLTGLHIIRHTM